MAYQTKRKRDLALIADLLDGQLDIQALAHKHELSLCELARWVMADDIFRSLTALCALADFQTQFVLGQHRVTAAAALIRMANGEGDDADLQRKACVDVLRLNMPRVDVTVEEADEKSDEVMPVEAIRQLMNEQEGKKQG